MRLWTKSNLTPFYWLRSINYFAQFHALTGLSLLFPFARRTGPGLDPENFKLLTAELRALYTEDSENIEAGFYPATVLKPESLLDHSQRVPKIFFDGLKIQWRRSRQKNQDFSQESAERLKDTPDYFQRNFHFQTDGYLSEKSAELYEHQVELLFAGSAAAMRRQLIRPIKETLRQSPDARLAHGWQTGEGLNFLEVACGTGVMTKFMKLAFPKAKIVAADVSSPYLKVARQKLADFESVDFIQTAAEKLPFQDATFDVVYSVYLFHELPLAARQAVIAETQRVLRTGGLWGYVDSLQLGDNPPLDHALQQFPKDFHEPFYTNYIKSPMNTLITAANLTLCAQGHKFLSRFGVYRKN